MRDEGRRTTDDRRGMIGEGQKSSIVLAERLSIVYDKKRGGKNHGSHK